VIPVAVATAFAAMSGAAFASGLPARASSTAGDVLDALGISAPAPSTHSGSGDAGHRKGATVSQLATTTTAPGVDKGAQISALASGGKSHAGEHAATAGDAGAATGDEGTGKGKGRGKEVSQLARTTEPGPEHGVVVSTAASGGKSHAGQHGHGASGKVEGTTHGGGNGHRQGGGNDHATQHGQRSGHGNGSTHRGGGS
jgi:hypothetical protein